jgi:hypothetical protein
MALPRVLVLVLAGGAGGRLELLTEQRAKPAVPFAGVYRLIDFPLSNCQHSHLADVWVSVQFHPTSLSQHLANGRPWDLDRTDGGLLDRTEAGGRRADRRQSGGGGAGGTRGDRAPGERLDLGDQLLADALHGRGDAADVGRLGDVVVGAGGEGVEGG